MRSATIIASPAEATPLLVGQADRVATRWPVLAAEMLADAANGATTINSYLEAERLAGRAVDGFQVSIVATF